MTKYPNAADVAAAEIVFNPDADEFFPWTVRKGNWVLARGKTEVVAAEWIKMKLEAFARLEDKRK